MDNLRTFLILALAFFAVLIWQAWQEDYVYPKPEQQVQQVVTNGTPTQADVPSAKAEPTDAVELVANTKPEGELIRVTTDVYELSINTQGGTIDALKLLNYPITKGAEEVVQLMSSDPTRLFVVESGLLTTQGDSPTHHAVWQTDKTAYTLTGDSLTVPLVWHSNEGIKVTKTYTFTKGSYKVAVKTNIENNSEAAWPVREYLQLKRKNFVDQNKNAFLYTYTGGVFYTQEEKYQKIDFEDMMESNLSQDAISGWFGLIQHYFGSAWVPATTENYRYYTKTLPEGTYVMGAFSQQKNVAPGQRLSIQSTLFVGPKLQEQLSETAEGLELMVDYGKLTIIAEPLFWLLSFFHSFVGNWGVAIILVTFTIKALFFKLSEKSYRSMAQMKIVQPRIVALKERYGDDKQKLNQAMMELYKTEKINPLGGCFPILIQIPVFIALYWTLLESVELRQAPFMLWVDNLSAADPYFILPVIYGVTMFLQQRLNPAPVDPMQKKVMQMLPIIFTGFFAFFPAGLVLYWIVNNILTILQQSIIMKRLEAGENK